MAISPVQNNEPPRINYLGAATIGALAGYSLKYILPVSTHEKDDVFISKMNEIKSKAKNSTLKEIEGERVLKAYTKRIRPTTVFVFLGVITALIFTSIKSLKTDLANENQGKPS